jgi:hypothetical protein
MTMNLSRKKALVRHFLTHCNRYADGKLAEYGERLASGSVADRQALVGTIAEWRSYKSFNEHAIAELDGETLDGWFEDFDPSE